MKGEIEQIREKKIEKDGTVYYLVKYHGYGESQRHLRDRPVREDLAERCSEYGPCVDQSEEKQRESCRAQIEPSLVSVHSEVLPP